MYMGGFSWAYPAMHTIPVSYFLFLVLQWEITPHHWIILEIFFASWVSFLPFFFFLPLSHSQFSFLPSLIGSQFKYLFTLLLQSIIWMHLYFIIVTFMLFQLYIVYIPIGDGRRKRRYLYLSSSIKSFCFCLLHTVILRSVLCCCADMKPMYPAATWAAPHV